MSRELGFDLSCSIVFLWLMYVIGYVWLWPIWTERRIPTRDDAPTGDQPWVKPRDKLAG